MPYLFDTLRTSDIVADMHYRATDPAPGDPFPDFTLPTLDGTTLTREDLAGAPAVVVFGSQTCPVTRSALPPLNELHGTYGHQVRFVLVQTREAHPGEHLPQPQDPATKARHATQLRDTFAVPYEVAVDDVHGTLHRAVGHLPDVVRHAGPRAEREVWTAAAPLALR